MALVAPDTLTVTFSKPLPPAVADTETGGRGVQGGGVAVGVAVGGPRVGVTVAVGVAVTVVAGVPVGVLVGVLVAGVEPPDACAARRRRGGC